MFLLASIGIACACRRSPSLVPCPPGVYGSVRFCRYTNPSATEADLLHLQKEILREVLSYTPGHPSFKRLPIDDDAGDGDDGGDDDDDGPPKANTGTAMPRPSLTSSSSRA